MSAGRSFLVYWKPEFADEFIRSGHRLEHIGSKQFRRVQPQDELWIVTVRGGALFLVGHLRVSTCTDFETVRDRFPHDEVWPARNQLLCSSPEPFRDLEITRIATALRFQSKHDRLASARARIYAQQLQTLRVLDEESADLLRLIWDSRIHKASGPRRP